MNLINRRREEQEGPQPVPQEAVDRLTTLAQAPGYADEAARAAQRYRDMAAEVEALTSDLIGRLEQRNARLEQQNAGLENERDQYRRAIAVLHTQLETASRILLDGFAVIEGLKHLQVKVDMPALAKAIENEPPLPGFIARGPATDEERERGT